MSCRTPKSPRVNKATKSNNRNSSQDCINFKQSKLDPEFEASDLIKYYPRIKILKKIQSPENNCSPADNPEEIVLSKPEDVCLSHREDDSMGVGMYNRRNSCYLISVLQCLRYTPPLFNYLQTDTHTISCGRSAENLFCLMCEMKNHFIRTNENIAFFPKNIVQNLDKIANNFNLHQQQDAHEFLRFVLEAMHKCCTFGHKKISKTSEITSIVYRIFCGFLRSQVVCNSCLGISNTFEPFFDLAIDIKMDSSLTNGLKCFFSVEHLTEENSYSCQRCKKTVSATKKMTINQPPNVLTFQLKKFSYDNRNSQKVTKKISFGDQLDIRPYMCDTTGRAELYSLYAVIVHQGYGIRQGHYMGYVKSASGAWYMANDHDIQVITLSTVMNSNPYLLFYIRNDKPVTLKYVENDNVQTKPANASEFFTSLLSDSVKVTCANTDCKIRIKISPQSSVPLEEESSKRRQSDIPSYEEPAQKNVRSKPKRSKPHF